MPRGLGDFSAPHVPGELLVFAEGFTPQGLANRVEGVVPLKAFQGGFLRVRVPPGQERAKAEALLRAGARWVQPNYIYEPLALPPNDPNDPLYPRYQKPQLSGLVGLEAAWATTTGDPSLVLAVVDTGYLLHEDLSQRWYMPSGMNLDVADGDDDPTDNTPSATASQNAFSHGLAVASVIGAESNNAQGMSGVTWQGKLLPLKVAKSSDGSITTASVKEAVDLAVQLGAKVINLSLGGYVYDRSLEQSLSAARAQGVVLVAAAGNDGIDGVLYPASSPSVIAVGSVSNDKSKSYFSNCGPELDLVAPGERVTVLLPNNGYGFGSGTSFASPMVAGVAALYMSAYKARYESLPNPNQVYQCLTATAEDLGPPGHDTGYGFGLVRADRVMADSTHCFP
ncbi:MAG: S8 family serine peptidase [Thermus sp.]|uniref:S8 family peptidase n=1 Tax=Thermus sp. TaxID=275 RepID=UPI00351B9D3E